MMARIVISKGHDPKVMPLRNSQNTSGVPSRKFTEQLLQFERSLRQSVQGPLQH